MNLLSGRGAHGLADHHENGGCRDERAHRPRPAHSNPLMEGKGTIFLRADLKAQQRFCGPGHTGWLHDRDGKDDVVCPAYDHEVKGAPTLRIAPVRWGAEGWPVAEY